MLLYRFNKIFVLLEYGYLTIFMVIVMTLGYRRFYDFPATFRGRSGVSMCITPFGEKNFPLEYFVGHKHGRMLSCQ